jgi:carboxyl-terminal processing protease
MVIASTRTALALFFAVSVAAPARARGQQGTATAPDSEAHAILDKYVAALGGRELRLNVRTIDQTVEASQMGLSSTVRRITDVATGRFYVRANTPDGLQESGFDGTRYWQKNGTFHGYLKDDSPQVVQLKRGRDEITDYRKSNKTYKVLSDKVIDGRRCRVLETMQKPPQGNREVRVRLYFDAESGLLTRQEAGGAINSITTMSDYRRVNDGLLEPFKLAVEQNGARAAQRVLEVSHNFPVDDSLFVFRDGGARAGNSAPSAAPAPVNPAPSPADTALSEDVRLSTFDHVWQTVFDTYWDTTFNGVDWRAIRERYRPMVISAHGSQEFHKTLDRMVAELHQSHFSVTGPVDAAVDLGTSEEEFAKNAPGAAGIQLLWLGRELVVSAVRPGFGAERAGARPGYVVKRVGGVDVDSLYRGFLASQPHFALGESFGRVRGAAAAMNGKAGEERTLTIVDEKGHKRDLTVTLSHVPTDMSAGVGFESKRVAPGIGYVKFNVFIGDILQGMRTALAGMQGTRGVIIDLRGNPGGVGALTRGIASMLFAHPASLGVAKMRYETREYAFPGTGDSAYTGTVIVLVNELSASSSEVFAGGLQALGRALIVGVTTAGAVLPSIRVPLRSGGALVHPISDFRTPKGTILEGRGVVPDVVVKQTREALLKGKDLQLDEAIRRAGVANAKS